MKHFYHKFINYNFTIKTLLVSVLIAFSYSQNTKAQCGYNAQEENGVSITPTCNNQTANVGSGAFQRVNVTSGVVYDFNTCGSNYDTQIGGYATSGAYVGLFNDDNATGNNACGGGVTSGVNWAATFSGVLHLQVNTSNCTNWPGGGSAVLNYRIATPTTSTNGGNKSSCPNTASAGLGGNTPTIGTGTWTSSSPTVSFSNTGSANATATGTTPGTYTLTWTINNGGCTSVSTLQFTVDAPSGSIAVASPVCAGSSANITFNFSSGAGPYNVVYTDGTSNFNANGISNGATVSVSPAATTTYSLVSVTNVGTNCTQTTAFTVGSATLTVNQADNSAFTYSSATLCSNGSSDPFPQITGLTGGTFTSSPTGLSINSNTGQITLSTSTVAVPYVVTYTSNGPCPTSSTFALIVNSPPTVSFTGLNTSYCINDLSAVTLNGSPAGGTFSGLGVVTNTYNPSLTTIGNHIITYDFTDANGCTGTSTQTTLTNGLAFVTFSGLGTDYCISDNTPVTLTGSPTGGTFSGAGISGNTFTPSGSIVGLQTITYTYVDPNGCTNVITRQVNINALPTVAFAGLNASYCIDAADAPLTGFPTGGSFTGTGLNGTTFSPAIATIGGPYSVTYTYTDGNGCANTSTQSVSVNDVPVVALFGLNAQYCSNDAVVTVSVSPAGGSLSGSGTTGLTFDPSSSVIGSTTVTYLYTDANGCDNTATQNVTVNAAPTVNFGGLAATYCLNSPIAPLFGFPTGGTFSGAGLIGSSFDPSLAGSNTHTITYSFTDANSCTNIATNSTIVSATPTVSFTGLAASYCIDDATPVTLIGSPAGGTFSGNGLTLSVFTPSLAGIGSQDIAYDFTDASGCTGTATVTTIINDLPVVSFTGLNATYCVGNPASVLTSSPLGGTFSGAGGVTSGSFDPSISLAGSFPIVVSFTDANGCTNTATQTTIVNALPTPPVVTPSGPLNVCNGAATTLTAASGFSSYVWAEATANVGFGATLGVTQSGSYTVSVINASGCTATSAPVQVTVSPALVVDLGNDTLICTGSSFILDAGAGFNTYVWSNGGSTNQFNTVTAQGIYTVTVTNAQGCSGTDNISVTLGQLLQPVLTTNVSPTICQGDSVTLDAGAGYATYSWSDGGNTITQTITVGFSTQLTVTVTDLNGCTGTSTPTTVTVLNQPVINVNSSGPTEFCDGGSVTLIASSGFVQYEWLPGNVIGQTLVVNQPGTYTCTAVATNGCHNTSAPITVVVNMPPNPVITANGPTTFCNGQNVILTCTPGGQIYHWTSGATTQSLTVTQTGDYGITVEDGNGCVNTTYILSPIHVEVITPHPILTVSVNTFTVTTPFSAYQWYMQGVGGAPDATIPGANAQSYSATASGTYYVKVTDSTGCSASSTLIEHTYIKPEGIEKASLFSVFNLYPNPAQDMITVELGLNAPSNISITMVNARGQLVLQTDLGIQNKTTFKSFRVDQLAAGLYSVVVKANDQVLRSNFLKE